MKSFILADTRKEKRVDEILLSPHLHFLFSYSKGHHCLSLPNITVTHHQPLLRPHLHPSTVFTTEGTVYRRSTRNAPQAPNDTNNSQPNISWTNKRCYLKSRYHFVRIYVRRKNGRDLFWALRLSALLYAWLRAPRSQSILQLGCEPESISLCQSVFHPPLLH